MVEISYIHMPNSKQYISYSSVYEPIRMRSTLYLSLFHYIFSFCIEHEQIMLAYVWRKEFLCFFKSWGLFLLKIFQNPELNDKKFKNWSNPVEILMPFIQGTNQYIEALPHSSMNEWIFSNIKRRNSVKNMLNLSVCLIMNEL